VERILVNRRVQSGADVKVSAVIPFFNNGSVIDDALESVRRQSRPVDQIVVVDDGSTDSFSLAVLARLEGNGITVVRQPNRGPGSARNVGVGHSDGEALFFLDSDDAVAEGHVELALRTLAEAPDEVGFVYPDLRFMGNENRLLIMPPYNLYLLLHRNFCGMGGLVDRAVFDAGFQFRPDRLAGHEDWDFFVTLGVHGIFGAPLHGTPLRYRRWGYSRSDGVDEGQSGLNAARALHPEINRRGRLMEIKREWAPALSVIVRTPGTHPVVEQSCDDFEVVLLRGDGVPRVRGRWVLMLEVEGMGVLHDATFVERLLRLARDQLPSVPIALHPGAPSDVEWNPLVAPAGGPPFGIVAEGHFYLDWSKRVEPGATDVAAFCTYLAETARAPLRWGYTASAPQADGVLLTAFRPPRPPPKAPDGEVETLASEIERGFRHHETLPLFMPASGFGRLPNAPEPSQDGLGAIVGRAWSDWMPARSLELVLVIDVFGEATLETSASPIDASSFASSREPARLTVGCLWTQPFPGTACLLSTTDASTQRVTYRVTRDAAMDSGEAILGYLPVDILPGRLALERAIERCLHAVGGPSQVIAPQVADLTPEVYVEPPGTPPAWGQLRGRRVPSPASTTAADGEPASRARVHLRHRKGPGGTES
jgi:hypothetical protein